MSFEYSITLAGNGNKTSKKYVLQGADYATARANADAVKSALGNVTGAVIQSDRLTEVTKISSNFAGAGVQVENIASLAVKTVADKSAVAFIPAPVDSIFIGSSGDTANIVDIADADLVAYFNALSANTLLSDGEIPNTLVGGKRIHRKSKKG